MSQYRFAAGLACVCCLHGQPYGKPHPYGEKGEGFTENCFKNPSLPYCVQRDFVAKPSKDGDPAKYGTGAATPASTIDAAGIDWRFADPAADTLAVLDASKASGAALAHTVIEQLGKRQGLSADDLQTAFRALASVSQVALSIHDGSALLMVTGRASDSVLPAPQQGWKSLPLPGNTLLLGPSPAVDQAARRIGAESGVSELSIAALQRSPHAEFWLVGPAKLGGEKAAGAGASAFELTVAFRDRLAGQTVYRFTNSPNVTALTSLSAEEFAASPLSASLGTIISSARYLPARDSAATVHTRPVIYGLDGGPREVK